MERMLTKRGNKLPFLKKPKEMSKREFGILCNYVDFLHKQSASFCLCDTSIIGKLKRNDFDSLKYYGRKWPKGYSICKDVLLSPVGMISAKRYFITDIGKSRLNQLKRAYLLNHGYVHLCRCNKCNNVLIDHNPQINAMVHKLKGDELEMEQFDDNGDYFFGCPICETDEFLIDI